MHVPWYEPAAVEFSDADVALPVDDAPENALSTSSAADSDALATIELPHEDLDAPLDDGAVGDRQASDGPADDVPAEDPQVQMADTGAAVPTADLTADVTDARSNEVASASLPLVAEDAVPPTSTPTVWQTLSLQAITPYVLALSGAGIVALVTTWLAGYVRLCVAIAGGARGGRGLDRPVAGVLVRFWDSQRGAAARDRRDRADAVPAAARL